MKNTKILLIFAALIAVAVPLFSQASDDEMNSGVLYGENWACTIQAPSGWILDNQSWVKYGVFALFYPKGMTLRDINKKMPVIYFKAALLKTESDDALKNYVDQDILQISKDKSITIGERKIETQYQGVYYCYDIDYNKSGQYETVIYIRFKDGAHLIVLTSKDKGTRDENLENLIGVLEKMVFMNATVKK